MFSDFLNDITYEPGQILPQFSVLTSDKLKKPPRTIVLRGRETSCDVLSRICRAVRKVDPNCMFSNVKGIHIFRFKGNNRRTALGCIIPAIYYLSIDLNIHKFIKITIGTNRITSIFIDYVCSVGAFNNFIIYRCIRRVSTHGGTLHCHTVIPVICAVVPLHYERNGTGGIAVPSAIVPFAGEEDVAADAADAKRTDDRFKLEAGRAPWI